MSDCQGRVPLTPMERAQARVEEMYDRDDDELRMSRFDEAPTESDDDAGRIRKPITKND